MDRQVHREGPKPRGLEGPVMESFLHVRRFGKLNKLGRA